MTDQCKQIVFAETLRQLAQVELKTALTRIKNLKIQDLYLELPDGMTEDLEQRIGEVLRLFECKSTCEINGSIWHNLLANPDGPIPLYAGPKRPSRLRRPNPTPGGLPPGPSMTMTGVASTAAVGAVATRRTVKRAFKGSLTPLIYPNIGPPHNKLNNFDDMEILRSKMMIELLQVITSFIGERFHKTEMNLKPIFLTRVHEHLQEIVTLFTAKDQLMEWSSDSDNNNQPDSSMASVFK